MGSIGAMVGLGGGAGAQGLAWTPQDVALQSPITTDEAQAAQVQSQGAVQQQQQFLNALAAQNGIGNQSQVYNQLQGVANGTGPNPAQAMLNQSTGQNVANQAALMAGQRGASANTGLIARQAAQQGAATQQQAVGQGATMQAQQSLAALGQLQGLSTQQVAQQQAAQGAYTGAAQQQEGMLLGQTNAQNNAQLQQQQTLTNANQKQAAAGATAQQGLLGGASSAIMGVAGMAKGGMVRHYADGGPTLGMDNTMPQIQAPPPIQGAPAAPSAPTLSSSPSNAPTSNVGKHLKGQSSSGDSETGAQQMGNSLGKGLMAAGKGIGSLFKSNPNGDNGNVPAAPAVAQPGETSDKDLDSNGVQAGGAAGGQDFGDSSDNKYAKGGRVPAMVSPGERYLNPREVKKVAEGKKAAVSAGEKIPGKAKVKGDSLKNDIVPKTLEEGGIVLPKSVMEAKHPHWEAHKFVSAILAKQGMSPKRK